MIDGQAARLGDRAAYTDASTMSLQVWRWLCLPGMPPSLGLPTYLNGN